MVKINIFWFRRDLRLDDNHGLFKALQAGNVFPIFIFDPTILDQFEDKIDRRVSFIYSEIKELKTKLEKVGSTLFVYYGKPLEIFKKLVNEYHIENIYFNADYEPYAIQRDNEITKFLNTLNINAHSFKDQVIFEKDEIVKPNKKPYTIYTPYSKKWKEKYKSINVENYKSENLTSNFYKTIPSKLIGLDKIGFTEISYQYPSKFINKDIISDYDKTRDYPSINGTTRLSLHLRFGTISIRRLAKIAQELNSSFLNELIWREFYMMILWHFPHVVNESFKKEYDDIEWRNNEKEFEVWCQGKTGYGLVDAGMRELNETGFMHNRLRMITASFLTKHLLIDWRWGEAYFAQKLLDYELSSNNGGWQWAASTGCDAVPYFRIFNPHIQAKKFDPKLEYITRWVPEYNTKNYPQVIVDHNYARNRALNAYKKVRK